MRWTLFVAILLAPVPGRADQLLGNSVKRGDIYVEISKALVSPVGLVGPGGKVEPSDKEYLVLIVAIINYHPSKGREYRGWAADRAELDERVVVRDDLGNTYRRVRFGDRKVQKQQPDGKLVTNALADLLVFEKPSDKARELRVTLAGSQLGEKEDFQINLRVQRSDPSDDILYDADIAAKEFLSKGASPQKGERLGKEQRRRDEPQAVKMPEDKPAPRAKKEDSQAEKSKPSSKSRKRIAERQKENKENRDERAAASKLQTAETLRKAGDVVTYRKLLHEIVDKFPETEAGKKAAKLLK